MVLNLPNTLTLFRIFLVPLLVVVLLTPPWAVAKAQETIGLTGIVEWVATWREILALTIFLLAAATDWLDGYLARSRNQVTDLGKLLDPIADKLLTVSAFISLVELRLAPAWMVVIIVGREFAISGMRSVAASRGLVIPASNWGKYKTVSQIIAISLLILTPYVGDRFHLGALGIAALWIVLFFTIYSMFRYVLYFAREIDLGRAE